jgi:hypothetical protein
MLGYKKYNIYNNIMLESYYIIKSLIENNNKYYYVNITETKYEYNILVGGIKMKCVNIIIQKKRDVALLELVQHHDKCSLFSDLQKGYETEDLLKNSLYFTITKFPNIKYFEFIDNSFILCNNKKKISLPDISFVKYQKTWYERKFNAEPKNMDKIKYLKKLINKICKRKIRLDYKDFINEYYTYPYFERKNRIDIIKNIYHKNMTLSEFLVNVNNYDCIFYEKIFNDMIGNILQGTNWIITWKKIEEYNMTSNIMETNKIKENDNLNVLFRKLNLLNRKENKKMGGNIYHSGII